MNRNKVLLAMVIALVLATSGIISAQTITGTILGTVTDKTGAVLPKATVTISNTGTGLTRSAVTDEQGRYEARALPVGNYEVKVELSSFGTQVRQLPLNVGAEVGLNFSLEVGTVQQQVQVTSEAALVQTSSAEVAALVDQRMIQELPLNARDVQQLATVQPGVQSQAAYNGLYGANISVRGARPEQNKYLLNGIDASTSFGTSPVSAANIMMGVEGLEEFKVMSSDYSAAYGGKQGGVVTMVTKSGTNRYHGSLYEFHRDSALDAQDYFAVGGNPPLKRDQFGASLGGPIRKEKTFFFVNYEQFRQRMSLSDVGVVPTDRARAGYVTTAGKETYVGLTSSMAPFMALIPHSNGPVLKGDPNLAYFYSSPNQGIDERYGTIRVDHRLTNKDQFWAVVTGDWSLSGTPEPNPNFEAFNYRNKKLFSAEDVHSFSNNLLGDFRFGLNKNYYFDETTAIVPVDKSLYVAANPYVTPSGRGAFESIGFGNGMTGMANTGNAPVWYNHTGLEWDAEFSYMAGAHTWKIGGNYSYSMDDGSYSAVQARGEITFQTLQSFLAGSADLANVILPGSDPTRNFRSSMASAYAEDSWRVSRNFTLSMGLRWEALLSLNEARGKFANLRGGPMDPTPTVGNPILIAQKNNLAPRFGFAWDVTGDGKTSVRGGAGIFYNQINPFSLRESSNNAPITVQVSLINAPFPNVFSAIVPTNITPDFGAIQFRPETPLLYSYHASFQREVAWKTVVSASYIGSRGRNLPSGAIVNSDFGNRLLPQTLPNGQLYWPAGLTRPNPNFGRIGYDEFVFGSSYNSMQLQAERRFAAFTFSGNYTRASCWADNSGELNTALGNGGGPGVMQYARNLSSGYGPCAFTSVNSGNILSTWSLPGQHLKGVVGSVVGGWRWSTITSFQSGLPFNVSTGFNRSRQNIGTSALGDRPNWAPGCNASNAIVGRITEWFNPQCFVLPDAGYLGNVPAMALRGPGLFTSDWSLAKDFGIKESKRVEVQAQLFNIFNHPNFAVPAAALWSNANSRRGTAGIITRDVVAMRQMQLGIKFAF